MVLVYPIGVPLTLLFMIRGKVQRQTDVSTQNDEIEENAPSTVCCGRFSVNALDDASEFLMSGIESECWYYEVTELVRKLLLSSVIIFVHPGTFVQIAAALLVCVGFMTNHFFSQPFIEGSADNLQSVCLVQLFLTLFAGMVFKAGMSSEVPAYEYQLYTWLLLVCNYGAIACGILVVLLEAQVGQLLRALCKRRDSDSSSKKKINAVSDAEPAASPKVKVVPV